MEALSDTPLLRVQGMQPVKLDDELTGYTVTFDIGTGRKDSIVELDSCKVKSFQVEALQGGSVKILFTVQAANLKEKDFGRLCTLIDCEVSLLMLPPEDEQQASRPDGVGRRRAGGLRHALRRDMAAIWKYPLTLSPLQLIHTPRVFRPLSVQVQDGVPTIWAEVEPGGGIDRAVTIVGTGGEVPPFAGPFLGTVQLGEFVWHVYVQK
jgi:hypothetical protein